MSGPPGRLSEEPFIVGGFLRPRARRIVLVVTHADLSLWQIKSPEGLQLTATPPEDAEDGRPRAFYLLAQKILPGPPPVTVPFAFSAPLTATGHRVVEVAAAQSLVDLLVFPPKLFERDQYAHVLARVSAPESAYLSLIEQNF